MKPVRLLVAVLAASLAFVGLAVGTASATTVEDCQSQLATLTADTLAAQTSFTNQKSAATELEKLTEASAKLAEGKTADAVQKLVDFQSTLTALATASTAKVDATTSTSLTAEAQGVIDCINAVDTVDATDSTA